MLYYSDGFMRTISNLYWHEKYTFIPPKIFKQIFPYCSQLPTLLAERVLEKFCRGSRASCVTAAGRLPWEVREIIIFINTGTKLFFCRSQSTLRSYNLSQGRENRRRDAKGDLAGRKMRQAAPPIPVSSLPFLYTEQALELSPVGQLLCLRR